ncbi:MULTISPECIES: dihydrolipoamide acetyltransferase family protein [Streptomyces]|uniref:Dihydrolipoamide acetyltransferase component of pyruvate dehydrogenase complex n=1 Tax=Streptomyces doudnae TaxID=3075536 RepID=A0ABD5ERE4_9ACTN|nr:MULTISPECIES: dihydrolipoamide acetyltransferase family protein [unclassified Streptomyces]MDT0436863.1 dihydrolipoamide acetyltransferase family protein [Streptomyces sp. DSM 41981]MYQ67983.1 2-oxo acid dehydrogenase subunit E2 [Streptomyces sp. SID4950]SCE41966.1 pyruvate dehydrogenase E2 component (dihydrolipoamide acetyltransferase) [Streptomyces sp. SolWspMP-5a-2]
MAQVLEFRLPDLGEGLTEAEIVRWLVQVGDVVAIDQPVVEVETAKAMVEVPCPYGGVVTARFGEQGSELPVGAPLLTVAVGAPAADPRTAPSTPAPEPEGSGNVLVGYGTTAPPARRRRVRPDAPTGAAGPNPGAVAPGTAADGTVAGAGSSAGASGDSAVDAGSSAAASDSVAPVDGRAVPVDGRAVVGAGTGAGSAVRGAGGGVDGPVAVISPLVRRLARENGLDLRGLAGSGRDGLILRADVERALGGTPPSAPAPADATAPVAAGADGPGATRVPLKGVRGAVADKLARSRREIPDATCWVDADATELLRARAAMNAAGGPKISLLAVLARICVAALARFPELNSTVDTAAREVVLLPQVHLGFAAQTERGLVVPVVRDAHTRDAESLSAEFARLTEAGRSGRLTPGDLTGGTFTLNNYGVFGVDGSTPIVNHPEAAMLGVGRIVPKPWVHEGELAVRQVVQLSLTFDHRVCDGGTAGGFLRYVADCVEQPAVLLRTL